MLYMMMDKEINLLMTSWKEQKTWLKALIFYLKNLSFLCHVRDEGIPRSRSLVPCPCASNEILFLSTHLVEVFKLVNRRNNTGTPNRMLN